MSIPEISDTTANPVPAHAPVTEDSAPVFTLFAVFRVSSSHPNVFDGRDVIGVVREFEDVVEVITGEGVTLRGCYDVSGMRSDADVMLWLHGSAAEDLQWAIRELRRTELLRPLVRVWGAVGVHRAGELHPEHVPGFVRGVEAKHWLALSPFVGSVHWDRSDDNAGSRMLAEQGRTGAGLEGVTSNTVAAFGLGEHEWLLPMESDVLTELVDTMRALRGIDGRRLVHEEAPFFTGRRVEIAEVIEVLQ